MSNVKEKLCTKKGENFGFRKWGKLYSKIHVTWIMSKTAGFQRFIRDATSVRAFTSKLITSNLKRMHIIAALGDQQILCYQSRLKNKVQNFYRRIVRIYMHFDLHVIAEQGKSFLLFNKILMNINSLYFCLKWKHGEILSNSHSSDYQKWFWWKSLDC